DAQAVERARHRQLGRHVEREARRLFAVAERRVEDRDSRRVAHATVVAAGEARSQSDNSYAKIIADYGPRRAAYLPRRRPRAQLLAGGRKGASYSAGGQPGGASAGARARRAAFRSIVEDRHPDRGRPHAPELRPAACAPRGGNRIGGSRAARPAARTRAD